MANKEKTEWQQLCGTVPSVSGGEPILYEVKYAGTITVIIIEYTTVMDFKSISVSTSMGIC